MGWLKKIFRNPIVQVAAPIAGSLLLPGLGTALGLGGLTTATGAATSLGGALGGGIGGAAAGGLSGGGLKGALTGGAMGAAGGYLANGGASELLGGTQLGNTLGLGSPEGGSLIGNALGGAPSGQTLGSSLGLTGANGALGNSAGSTLAQTTGNSALQGATQGTGLLGGITRATDGLSNLAGSGLATGGGMSSYGNLSTVIGGANAMSAQEKAKKALLNANQNAMNQIAPYLQTGNAANASLMDALGLSGNTGADNYGALTKEFNPTDLTDEPGYRFQLQQGNQALDRANAARGGYFSGAAMKAAQDYGQGLAGQTYKDAFNRDLQTKQNLYNQLAGQQGVGYNAAGNMASLFGDYGNIKANTGVNSADILAKTLASLTGSRQYNSNPFLASLGIA